MLDVLRKVDRTFEIRDDQRFTAVNAKGFEVNILRREAADVGPNAGPRDAGWRALGGVGVRADGRRPDTTTGVEGARQVEPVPPARPQLARK